MITKIHRSVFILLLSCFFHFSLFAGKNFIGQAEKDSTLERSKYWTIGLNSGFIKGTTDEYRVQDDNFYNGFETRYDLIYGFNVSLACYHVQSKERYVYDRSVQPFRLYEMERMVVIPVGVGYSTNRRRKHILASNIALGWYTKYYEKAERTDIQSSVTSFYEYPAEGKFYLGYINIDVQYKYKIHPKVQLKGMIVSTLSNFSNPVYGGLGMDYLVTKKSYLSLSVYRSGFAPIMLNVGVHYSLLKTQ